MSLTVKLYWCKVIKAKVGIYELQKQVVINLLGVKRLFQLDGVCRSSLQDAPAFSSAKIQKFKWKWTFYFLNVVCQVPSQSFPIGIEISHPVTRKMTNLQPLSLRSIPVNEKASSLTLVSYSYTTARGIHLSIWHISQFLWTSYDDYSLGSFSLGEAREKEGVLVNLDWIHGFMNNTRNSLSFTSHESFPHSRNSLFFLFHLKIIRIR